MENQPLSVIISKIKAKLNYPPTLSVNNAEDCRLAALANQEQEWLADQWSWPTLDEWWDIGLVSNQRFYPVPTDAVYGQQGLPWNKRRPLFVNRKYSTTWQELEYGIDEREYTVIDSDTGQTQDPVQKWDYNGTTQVEFWPIPASNYTIRFRGQRTLIKLTTGQPYDPSQPLGNLFNSDALCDLDSSMIVAAVVSFHYTEEGKALSDQQKRAFIETMFNIRAQMPTRSDRIFMGQNEDGDGERVRLAGIRIIAVAGGNSN